MRTGGTMLSSLRCGGVLGNLAYLRLCRGVPFLRRGGMRACGLLTSCVIRMRGDPMGLRWM